MERAGQLRNAGKAFAAMVALSFAISVFLLIIFTERAEYPGLRNLGVSLLVGMTYGMCIGSFCWLTMAVVARPIWRLHPVPRWGLLLLLFGLCAMAGTFLAVCIGRYVYPLGWTQPVVTHWLGSLRTSLAITFPIGIVVTLIEVYRERLRSTEVQLRTKEMERERAMKLASEAQLAALTARVEPHFLFNTLNTISSLVRDDPERAERTIERLSSLLRSSLDSTQAATVPLRQELELVASYLDIQSARFGGRLRFMLADAGGLDHVAVPPFSIQTLVENCVKYAVAPRREGGSIEVRLEREEGRVWVDVEDDGPGFTPQDVPAGHGIDNLQGRLRALYGAAASLEFIRAPGRMRVRMGVPA